MLVAEGGVHRCESPYCRCSPCQRRCRFPRCLCGEEVELILTRIGRSDSDELVWAAAVRKVEQSDVGPRVTRRIAYRLLPFVFLIYVVNYIDRVNVSFANLRMSADLGFSDRVYGLGVGIF
jgi:hypothetical protein